jgi:hypothetical protein
MNNPLLIAVSILIGLNLFCWFVFLIYTIVFRNDKEELNYDMPEIHTIRDIFKAMSWRCKYTAVGQLIATPVIFNWIAVVGLSVILILYLPCKLLGLIYKKIIAKSIVTKFYTYIANYISKVYNKFMDITIFK